MKTGEVFRPALWIVILGNNNTGKTTLLRCFSFSTKIFTPATDDTSVERSILLKFLQGEILLITLILCVEGALKESILYLSLYFKTHRLQYDDLLQEVRTAGHWEKWIDFFMQGVTETALLAVDTAQRLLKLFETDQVKINGLGKSASKSPSCSATTSTIVHC